MNDLQKDRNLQEAVNRREQKLPPLPTDLNERLMQRLGEPETAPKAKARSLWFYAAITAAACIALLIVFNLGKEQTPQAPLVAQRIKKLDTTKPIPPYHWDGSSDTPSTNEEPASTDAPIMTDAPVYQKNRPRDTKVAKAEVQPVKKPVKKQRKVVMQLVELIPTSEAEPTNIKTLSSSVIANVKAYDKQSDLSRMTGIDDTNPVVAMESHEEDTDPLVAMEAQVEDIRQRGMRLHEEIRQQMKN